MAENKQGNGEDHSRIMDRTSSKVKTPKNVRQIGKIGDGLAIYVEDYVKTYTKQLAETDYTSRCIAVLVGEYRNNEFLRNVFIYGAIKVEADISEGQAIFTEEVWTEIYEKIKQYFPEAEIVGWYYGGTGFGTEDQQILEDIQLNNFAGRDKVLFTYDVLEKENNFYLFDGVSMILQPGYYIYYEKNQEMQNYMVENKRIKREEEQVDDHAMREMRAILEEKKPQVSVVKEQKMMIRLGYAAGTLMMVVALIVGVSMINNNQRMKSLEDTISTYNQSIFDKEDQAGKDQQTAQTENEKQANKEQNSVEVGSSEAGLNKEPGITAVPTAEPTQNATSTPEPTVTKAPATVSPTTAASPTKQAEAEPTAAPVFAVDPDTLVEYTVKAGDTLASICTRECGAYSYLATVKEINKIEDENVIYIGQTLKLPPKAE